MHYLPADCTSSIKNDLEISVAYVNIPISSLNK